MSELEREREREREGEGEREREREEFIDNQLVTDRKKGRPRSQGIYGTLFLVVFKRK